MFIHFRCPVCQGFLTFSFKDDSNDKFNVYRCTRCTSSDERLFIVYESRLIEVRPKKSGGSGKDDPPRWYAIAISDDELRAAQTSAAKKRRFAEVQSIVDTALFFHDLEAANRARRARELLERSPQEIGSAIVADLAQELTDVS